MTKKQAFVRMTKIQLTKKNKINNVPLCLTHYTEGIM